MQVERAHGVIGPEMVGRGVGEGKQQLRQRAQDHWQGEQTPLAADKNEQWLAIRRTGGGTRYGIWGQIRQTIEGRSGRTPRQS